MNYWSTMSCRTMKGALARNGVSYKRLSSLLEGVGERVSVNAIAHRVSRGSFSFEFFLKVAKVIGIEELDLAFLSSLTPPPAQSLHRMAAGRTADGSSQLQVSATLRRPRVPVGTAIGAAAKEGGSIGGQIHPSPCAGRILEIANPRPAD